MSNKIGVSCRCGTFTCYGEKCNSVAYELAVLRSQWNFTLDQLWEEFLQIAATDAGIAKTENLLGHQSKYKQFYLTAAKQLNEK